MTTLDEFIKKWDGKLLDYDNFAGGQCVDLYRQYIKEVLEFPQSPPVTGAVDIWKNYLKDRFLQIENTPSGIPQKGEIVIWGNGLGKYGHVAIFVEGDNKKFTSFDQNYPVGTPCHIQEHNYRNVLGWLQPVRKEDHLKWLVQMFQEIGIDIEKSEGETRGRVQEIFDGYKKYVELERRIAKLERELAGAEGSAAEFETRLRTSEQGRERIEKEVQDLRDSVSLRETEIGKLNDQIKILEEQIAPDKNIIVSKEDYEKLTARRVLDRYSTIEIALELARRTRKAVLAVRDRLLGEVIEK